MLLKCKNTYYFLAILVISGLHISIHYIHSRTGGIWDTVTSTAFYIVGNITYDCSTEFNEGSSCDIYFFFKSKIVF